MADNTNTDPKQDAPALDDANLEEVAGGADRWEVLWTLVCDSDGDGDKEFFGIE